MKWYVLAGSWFMFGLECAGQNLPAALPGYIAMGAYNSHVPDVFSFTANQASLSRLPATAVAVWSEKRFLVPGLQYFMSALGLVTPAGNFGWKLAYSGFTAYHEIQLGMAHARKLGKSIDVGIQVNYHHTSIAGYSASSAVGVEFGYQFRISKTLLAGMHAANPVSALTGQARNGKLPVVYTAGFGYEPSAIVLVSAEIVKEENQPFNINAGISYQPVSRLCVQAGIAAFTASAWMGISVLQKGFRITAAATYHPQLGISPALMLLFPFFKSQNEWNHQ